MSPDVPVIEGYTELVQVAQGGFGIVYRGRREALDQDVAVKVLSLPNLSERDLDRFTRECRAAGNLSWHPHVVAVTDSGTTSTGQPYLAMEYLDNGSLADRLVADGPLPWADVVDIGIQVAGALGAAHAAGTLHRDLKPENVLVGHFGEAKLGDFGIAAVEGGARTATGHASYTVTHVAPEILRGQRPDERSDLYGLASTLFTLLTGRTPFAGDDPDEPIDLGGVDGVTPEQQATAESIVRSTVADLPQWADYRDAEAAGFHSIGDGGTGIEHFINPEFQDDPTILDPDQPESLVYDTSDGDRRLVAAMYMLEEGLPLEDVPDFGGALMQWHTHQNLCYTAEGVLGGLTNGEGECPEGLFLPEPTPMIHVWIEPHPCGPFAALEGIGGGTIEEGEEVLCDEAHGAPA